MGTLVQNEDPVLNRRVTENLIVIERDTPLPAKHTVAVATIHDDQVALDCSVTQSEGRENNQEFVNLIHQGTLNLPDKKPKGRLIDELTNTILVEKFIAHLSIKKLRQNMKYLKT